MNFKKAFLAIVLVILIATIVAAFCLPLSTRRVDGMPIVKLELQSLLNAVQLYQAEFYKYPSGNPSEISQAILGKNPKKHVFLSNFRTNNAGQCIDPWRTPYEITVESTNRVMIRSAGKNRSFGDKDDLTLGTSLR